LGEIKSTLDLVLEKTRNLTLSEEEKSGLAQKELDKQIQGLVNRYLTGMLPLERLGREMEQFEAQDHELAYESLKRHLIAHVDLDHDNESILTALSELVECDIAPFQLILEEYHAERKDHENIYAGEALDALKERGVSGSAVAPNLRKIPEWDQFLKDLHTRYRERLRALEIG